MEKLVLTILKIGEKYRAVVALENVLKLLPGEIVYQCSKEIEKNLVDERKAIKKLKEQAKKWVRKKWAREKEIPFVTNLDFDPYE
jgi:predicted ABC-type ATPase